MLFKGCAPTTSTTKCHYYEKPSTVPVASPLPLYRGGKSGKERKGKRDEKKEGEGKEGEGEGREIENENDRLGGAKASTRKPHVH